MARGAVGKLRMNSNPAEKQENDNDQQDQPQAPGRGIPQFLLCPHLGSAPKSAKTKNTINMVPSKFPSLPSCTQIGILTILGAASLEAAPGVCTPTSRC
jgi:hypothetical protein